jgi:FMN reductase
MSHVVAISGSPSRLSRTGHVLDYAGNLLAGRHLTVRRFDVSDVPAEDLLLGRVDSEALLMVARQIHAADGVIIGTPVYKAAYTGILKAFLDLLDRDALAEKVVLPIALGGTPHHFLMLDYALKPVLYALGARQILGGVYILDTQVKVEEGKEAKLDEEADSRLRKALYEFSHHLVKHGSAVLGSR